MNSMITCRGFASVLTSIDGGSIKHVTYIDGESSGRIHSQLVSVGETNKRITTDS